MIKTNILQLAEFNVTHVTEQRRGYEVHAEVTHPLAQCPHCQQRDAVIVGYREDVILDAPVKRQMTTIRLRRKRFQCASCREVFLEVVPHKDGCRPLTRRLVQYIELESLRHPFLHVSRTTGVTEGAVRSIFNDYCTRLEQAFQFHAPRWLGVHSITTDSPRVLITNVEQHTVLDVLHSPSTTSLQHYLGRQADRDQVEHVAIGMSRSHKKIIAEMLPDATVVIEKTHIFSLANAALVRACGATREDFNAQQNHALTRDLSVLCKRRQSLTDEEYVRSFVWTLPYPEIAEAHFLRGYFVDVWDCRSRSQAQAAYRFWLRQVTPRMRPHFAPLINAVDEWYEEVFAYFDHPTPEAYSIKLEALSVGAGTLGQFTSFEALRANVRFTASFQKIIRPTLKHVMSPKYLSDQNLPALALSYGSDMTILLQEMHAGRL